MDLFVSFYYESIIFNYEGPKMKWLHMCKGKFNVAVILAYLSFRLFFTYPDMHGDQITDCDDRKPSVPMRLVFL